MTNRAPSRPSKGSRARRENDDRASLVAALRSRGWLARVERQDAMTPPGWPDLIVFGPGGAVLLPELKSGDGPLRPAQVERLRRLRAQGLCAFVLRDLVRLEDPEGVELSLDAFPAAFRVVVTRFRAARAYREGGPLPFLAPGGAWRTPG